MTEKDLFYISPVFKLLLLSQFVCWNGVYMVEVSECMKIDFWIKNKSNIGTKQLCIWIFTRTGNKVNVNLIGKGSIENHEEEADKLIPLL